jgi:hypothetical protein
MTHTSHTAPHRVPRAAHNRITTLLVAATFAAVTACAGDSSSTGPSTAKPVGAYELRQVDGNAVPAKIYHGPYFDAATPHFYNQLIVEVTQGTIELDADGRFLIELGYRFTGDGKTALSELEDEGEYRIQGDEIQFASDEGGQYTATLQNGTIDLPLPNTLKKEQPIVRYSFRR